MNRAVKNSNWIRSKLEHGSVFIREPHRADPHADRRDHGVCSGRSDVRHARAANAWARLIRSGRCASGIPPFSSLTMPLGSGRPGAFSHAHIYRGITIRHASLLAAQSLRIAAALRLALPDALRSIVLAVQTIHQSLAFDTIIKDAPHCLSAESHMTTILWTYGD